MLLSFRQGLVQHEASGFLTVTPVSVSLVVVNTPTIVAIASGTKDYLHVERESVPQAWGPITPGVDQWLYWDINATSGLRTFGITLQPPLFLPTEPVVTIVDQHWFDTTANNMKVWNGTRWVEKIRVFACKLSNGAYPVSMSPSAPAFTGSQVGINTSAYTGQIMFDSITGNVLKAGTKFVTTEDVLSIQSLTKSDVKFSSMVVEAEAQQAMDAYTIVNFIDFRKVTYAGVFVANGNAPFGIIQQSCIPGDTVTVLVAGAISSMNWDWTSVGVNAPLYCTASGTLTPYRQMPEQLPVALIIDTRTILLGAPTNITTGDTIVSTSSLDALTDVTLTTPQAADVLSFNGTQWVNSTIPTPTTNLDGLTDVTLTTPVTGNALTYNGSQWVNSIIPTPITNLNGLTDVTLTTPQTADVLSFNGSQWVNSVPSAPITNLNALTDVTLTTPVTGNALTYDGSQWVNSVLPTPVTNLDGLTDVTLTLPVTGNALTYNGTQWVNSVLPTPVTNLDGLTDVAITTPQATDVLSFNGTTWVNTVPAPSGPITWNATDETLYGPSPVAGLSNIAYGNGALAASTGGQNVAVGNSALQANTIGTNNIAIGYSAGDQLTTGSNNVIIGGYVGTAGMAGNIVLSTGDGTVRLQHDGTNWTSATSMSMTGLVLPGTTSTITLNGSVGTAGQVLTSAGPGATPTWAATGGVGSVTSVSVTTANGVSGTVATATSTPAITLTLGAITPSSITTTGRVSAASTVVPTAILTISTGTVSVDASLSNNFEIAANANFTLNNPTNLVKGMIINFEFIQDATGSRTITYGTMYKFPIDSDKSLSTSANSTDFMSCYYNGTSLLCSLGKRFQ